MASAISSTVSVSESIKYASTFLKIDRFKDPQVKANEYALLGRDVFVNLPTGFGKSVIFHAIPLCADYLRRVDSVFSAELTGDSSGLEGVDDGTELQTKPSSLVVIISPLVSLIRDQVKTLRKLGLRAIHFSDSTSPQQQDLIIKG